LGLTTAGIVIRALAAVAAGKAIAALLPRLAPRSVTYDLLLAGVSLLAGVVPAWGAARLDPMVTLKAEQRRG